MVEKKSRFTFVDDNALTAKFDEQLPKKRTHKDRGSSSESDVPKKRHKKEKKDKKDKKDKKRKKSSSSEDSSGDDEQRRIRNAAIAQMELKYNRKGEQKPERDAKKDEPAPKVN
jgi:pre-mRNA-splicing factor ATP-dependent RNA helicase DHX15/PRP43